MNIVFMGTPDFAEESLKALVKANHNIMAVFTVPDRPKGRGMKMLLSPVKEYSLENNFDIYQPEKLKGNLEMIEKLKELNPDIICVVAYGMILPKEILDIPKYGAINVHPSLLPQYRGSSPIQYAIMNGDKKTGVSTMYLDTKMDAGDIILQKEIEIGNEDTTGKLWKKLSTIGADLLVETLEKIESKTAPRIKQGDKFTLAPMLNKEMSRIDWENKTALEIKNLVRGLDPIMGTYTFLHDKKIKFWKVDILSKEEFTNSHKEFADYWHRIKGVDPGTIIYVTEKEGLYIKAKDQIISVLEVQAENGKRMNISDFLRGNRLQVIDRFE